MLVECRLEESALSMAPARPRAPMPSPWVLKKVVAVVCVAVEAATSAVGMLVECRLEGCALSMAPSRTCAQLHSAWILTMGVRVVGEGAQAGAWNGRTSSSAGPIQTQTKPPASCVG